MKSGKMKKIVAAVNWWFVTLSFFAFIALESAVVYFLLKHFRVIS